MCTARDHGNAAGERVELQAQALKYVHDLPLDHQFYQSPEAGRVPIFSIANFVFWLQVRLGAMSPRRGLYP